MAPGDLGLPAHDVDDRTNMSCLRGNDWSTGAPAWRMGGPGESRRSETRGEAPRRGWGLSSEDSGGASGSPPLSPSGKGDVEPLGSRIRGAPGGGQERTGPGSDHASADPVELSKSTRRLPRTTSFGDRGPSAVAWSSRSADSTANSNGAKGAPRSPDLARPPPTSTPRDRWARLRSSP